MASNPTDSELREEGNRRRLPEWLRRKPASASGTHGLKRLLRQAELHTVCEEARCPNISECFSRGTATFMILGDICTRGCRFCAVATGRPLMPESRFADEAERVADAAAALRLNHVVVTSVARDDLEDGGARGFRLTIEAIRRKLPGVSVEVLVPDFRGREHSLYDVLAAEPDVFNHNLETVPRLYRKVRPGAGYQRSLDLLQNAKKALPRGKTKTGIMLGLGEQDDEVRAVLRDARAHGVDIFTAGQYLQPTREHLPVSEYLSPEKFEFWKNEAMQLGFSSVAAGPLVRSSYHAEEFV